MGTRTTKLSDDNGKPITEHIDPTANVIALVKAEKERSDDLRLAEQRFQDSINRHAELVTDLRAKHAEILRTSDLDRIDKTRQVDVLAAAASASALATAVQTLATTSDRNAETLRNLVNATATTMAKQTADQAAVLSSQTDSLVKDINARILELQRTGWQGAGRQSVADPQMAEFMTDMKRLLAIQATGAGKVEGATNMWGYVAGGIGFLFMLASGVLGIITFMTKLSTP